MRVLVFILNYSVYNRMEVFAMSDSKNVVTKIVTKKEVIKSLAKDFDISVGLVGSIYNRLEDRIQMILASADDKTNVEIRLFNGVKLESKFIHQREKLDNLTGKMKIYDSKIKAKATFARRYIENLNRQSKERII